MWQNNTTNFVSPNLVSPNFVSQNFVSQNFVSSNFVRPNLVSMKFVSPNFRPLNFNPNRVVGKEPIYSKKPKPLDPHQEQMHKRRVRLAEESKKADTNETGNGSNNRKQLEKIVTPFDDAKKKLILEFFIEHFIQVMISQMFQKASPFFKRES